MLSTYLFPKKNLSALQQPLKHIISLQSLFVHQLLFGRFSPMELEICLPFLTVSSILPTGAEAAVGADRNMLEVSLPFSSPPVSSTSNSHLVILKCC